MTRYHVSNGWLHVDITDAADEIDAIELAAELAPELTDGSVEPSKPDPVIAKDADAE